VFDRRFLRGDPLAMGGDLGFAAADLFVDLAIRASSSTTAASVASTDASTASRSAVNSRMRVSASASARSNAPIDQPDLRPQSLEAIGVFLVTPRLAGLRADAPQAAPTSSTMSPAAGGSGRRVPAAAGPRPSSA